MEGRLGEGTLGNFGARRFEEAEINLQTILENELNNAIFEFPFSSLARAYRLGEPDGPEAAGLPEKFGGDCLEQVKRLHGQLHAQRVNADAILSPAEMHFALIVSEGETDYYLDPSINAVEPVDLTDGQRAARTYPRLANEWSKLTATVSNDRITSTWKMVEGSEKIRTFNPNIEDPSAHLDLTPQRAFFATLRDLYWNTIDPETGALLKLRVPKKGESALGIHTAESHGYQFEGKSENFSHVFGRIVECSGESEATVRDFIEKTRNRWRAFSTQV